jgi:hypothetical protein
LNQKNSLHLIIHVLYELDIADICPTLKVEGLPVLFLLCMLGLQINDIVSFRKFKILVNQVQQLLNRFCDVFWSIRPTLLPITCTDGSKINIPCAHSPPRAPFA